MYSSSQQQLQSHRPKIRYYYGPPMFYRAGCHCGWVSDSKPISSLHFAEVMQGWVTHMDNEYDFWYWDESLKQEI
jgi:hypothetical protein